MEQLQHYINGQTVAPAGKRFGDVFNPATGKVQRQVPMGTAAEVDSAVQAARAALGGWSAMPVLRRARCIFRLKNLLEQHAECPPVPDECTPLYRNNECCHFQYTCPRCNYDPQGRPVKPLDSYLRRRRRRHAARLRRERQTQPRVAG